MKLIVVLVSALSVIYAQEATTCNPEECVLPDCRCSTTDTPGGILPEQTPQLVFFTFDDAINTVNYEMYQEAFAGKVNPDGCPVAATFFMSHEYTDYTRVHELRNQGHEIALHSITHNPTVDYWKNLEVTEHVAEFGGEREIIAKFADIGMDEIRGLRVPLLQLSGDNTYAAMQEIGLLYDCSWPTQHMVNPGLWPYTLDYKSTQDCALGPCPTSSFPGTWIVPMIMWRDDLNVTCSMVDACTNIPDDVDGIYNFILRNFNEQYQGNRAPFGFYVHAAWFEQRENAFAAYLKFVDHLQTLPDVYAVGISRGLEWVRNPQPLATLNSTWSECQPMYQSTCSPTTCALKKGDEDRYMTFCGNSCPDVYPWLHNPMGNA